MNRVECLKFLTNSMPDGLEIEPSVAENLIKEAEIKNCEPTSRLVSYPESMFVEFSASSWNDSERVGVRVYYYPPQDAFYDADGNPIEDLSNIDWIIEKYEVY